MYQLCNLINRSGVPADPEKNMKAAEDFLLLLLHAHVVAAAKTIFVFESGLESVAEVAKSIVNTFLLLPLSTSEEVDGVNTYAKELLTLGLLWHEFHDAIREGDGARIILCWKVMLPVFQITNHRNYLKEAVNLLLQCSVLSERKTGQLLWSRCINTQGRIGCNIPCDLHQEHLNRRLKTVLRSLGANITPKAVVHAGKSLATVHKICLQFEIQTTSSTSTISGVHNIPSFEKDLKKVLALLIEENVMEPVSTRSHQSFTFKEGLLQKSTDTCVKNRIQALTDKILAAQTHAH